MHHRWKHRAGATVLALAAALTVLPVYAAENAATSASHSPQTLPSPLTADAFTEAVLAENASLEAMRQAVVAALAQVKPAGALDDPMLSVSAAPRTFGSSVGPSGDVEVSQALPWWGTLDARRQVAHAEAEAANRDLEALRLHLAALARGAFADWVFVDRALDINASNRTVLEQLRDIARVRYTTGQAPEEDILQADVERTMLREQQLEWERQRAVVQARMNALLNRSPGASLPSAADLPLSISLPAEEILAQRALTHPRLGELEAQEQAAQAREHLAEKERFPKFGLSAGYNNMWADPAMRPMVGVTITVPIDQSKYRAAIDAARAEAHRAASTLADQRSSVLADLAAAFASARQSAQSLVLYRDELVPLARETLEVARSEYASGRGDFLNVLTAEQRRLDTELGLARMQSEYYERLAELEQASGGGLLSPATRGMGVEP